MSSGPTTPFPPATGPTGSRPPNTAQRRSRAIRLLLGLVILAFVGPCAYQETPHEVARWHLAAALEHREAGRNEAAWESLARARSWDPKNPILLLKESQWHKADREFDEALKAVDEAAELRPDHWSILVARAEILQHLGRHEEAIDTWKQIDRISLASGQPQRESALNGLAYARAVGNAELEQGLDAINEALKLAPREPALLDTRGFLLYRLGRYKEALADLKVAVRDYEGGLQTADANPSAINRVVYYSNLSEPQDQLMRQGTAVVRYHEALVLEKLGRYSEAKLDKARARLLIGREPDETLF